MADHAEAALGAMVEVAAGAAAGEVPRAGNFKAPVACSREIWPASHTRRLNICREAPRRGRDSTDAINSAIGINHTRRK